MHGPLIASCCLHFSHPRHANGLFDVVAETNLLCPLHVSSDEIDFLAHLTIAPVPFQRDQAEADAVEDKPMICNHCWYMLALSPGAGV